MSARVCSLRRSVYNTAASFLAGAKETISTVSPVGAFVGMASLRNLCTMNKKPSLACLLDSGVLEPMVVFYPLPRSLDTGFLCVKALVT